MISSEPRSRQAIALVLGALGSVDVECLDLARRSVEMVDRRDFGLVVADVRAGDSIALLGDLGRRLAGVIDRGVPVVIGHGPGEGELPAIAALVRQAGAGCLARPIEPAALLALVDALVGVHAGASAAPVVR